MIYQKPEERTIPDLDSMIKHLKKIREKEGNLPVAYIAYVTEHDHMGERVDILKDDMHIYKGTLEFLFY